MIADAPQLRTYIDEYLGADIDTELEDLIVSGDGVGENFTGLMTVTGTQTFAAPVAPASNLDNIRKAMTLVRVNARSEPTAIVLNPTDAQNIDLLKANNEPNNFAGPGPYGIGTPRLWGVPVVETDALTAGTALVGDFSKGDPVRPSVAQHHAGNQQRPIRAQHDHGAGRDQGPGSVLSVPAPS